MISRALVIALAFLTLLGASHAIAASAPSYPARPVRVIVPYAAGGSSDVLARIVGQRLSERLGQQFVVDNRAGAGTLIGTEIAANAAADGYTLLVATPPLVVNPLLYRKVSYAVDRDFAAVTNIAASSNLLVVHPSLTAASVDDLVTLLRSQPGKYTYGSSGVGGAGHLATALFAHMTGVDIVHVPYKGGGPAVTDLLGGQIQMIMVTPLLVEPHARAGKLKLIAAATKDRIERLPSLPTVSESGVPGYEAGTWFALVGPAGMPRDVTSTIHRDVTKVLNEPAFKERYVAKQWFEVVGNTPDEFARFLQTEYERWERLVKLSGVKVE